MLYERSANLQIGRYQEEGLMLDGFRIAFTVNKSITDEPNSATIEVSNLSTGTRNKIRPAAGELAILRAGYAAQGELPVIYIGDMTNVAHDIMPPTITTRIESSDGQDAIRTSVANLSFEQGTDARVVVQKLINQIGLPLQRATSIIAELPKMIFNNGFSFEGFAADAMNKLSGDLDFNWSVQNNELKITRKKRSSALVAIRLNPDSGLIGSPVRIRDVDLEDPEKTFIGWEIEALLQPKAEPADIIEVESRVISPAAQFEIHDVTHTGDTHGEAWTTKLRIRDLNS